MEKKKISAFVAGQRFNLITEESENYVRELASRVDARISSLMMGSNMSRERAAVMAALDLADDLEKGKQELTEIRGQVKDYLSEVQRLTEESENLKAGMSKNKLDSKALDDARKTIAEGLKEREALRSQILALKEQIGLMQTAPDKAEKEKAEAEAIKAVEDDPAPAAEPEPVAEEQPADEPDKAEEITAEDDLVFDEPREEPVKPAPRKEKKNRHDHSHVNPYKQQFMQKQGEQKGYTQQRQYSLFDNE